MTNPGDVFLVAFESQEDALRALWAAAAVTFYPGEGARKRLLVRYEDHPAQGTKEAKYWESITDVVTAVDEVVTSDNNRLDFAWKPVFLYEDDPA